jgi:hypothetical protein
MFYNKKKYFQTKIFLLSVCCILGLFFYILLKRQDILVFQILKSKTQDQFEFDI